MKKRFFAAFLCVVMLTGMLAAITVSAAEGVIDRVSLSGNTTFYSSKVEGKKLNVTAYDAEGNEVSLVGKEITYTSTRPWVFSIESDGTITDNGYDGTTLVTATVDGVPGSTIMIKSTTGTAATRGFENDLTAGSANQADGKAYYGYYSGTNVEADTNSRISGEKYVNKNWTNLKYNGAWDSAVAEGGANIRVAQGWFYDDGEKNDTLMFITLANKYVKNNGDGTYSVGNDASVSVVDGTNGYIPAWEKIGLSSSIVSAVPGSETKGYYFNGHIVTKADENVYYYAESYPSSVERSKGWHQVTLVMDDDGNVDEYIDGIKVNSTPHKPVANNTLESAITSFMYCDDFVFAQNLNTEEPEDFKLEAKSITLSRNETFIKSVDETKELVVTPLDKNGNEGKLPEGTTFTYESTRPWVLDIDDATGKFIDGGYDGTTKVTVTASNGMEASVIFIKNSNNDYANTSYQSGENTNTQGDLAGIGAAGLRFRGTWINALSSICWVRIDNGNVSDEDVAAAKIPGENYYKLPTGTTYTPEPGSAVTSGYDQTTTANSWYKEGLRVMQGWFYDDGTSAVHMRSFMSETSNHLGGAYSGNISHLYWQADIKAEAGADNYSITWTHDVTENTKNTIKRSKGWHQLITVLNDDMTFDVFIDGKLFSNSKSTYNGYTECKFYIAGASAGNFDEFVVAANPNTTEPVTITASADANGTVEPAKVDTNVGKNVEFTITPNEGYLIDAITYNGASLTATDNKITVTVVDGAETLSVTFKKDEKLPSVATAEMTNGITYITIDNGNVGKVTEAGIIFGAEGVTEMLKLIGYAEYTDENNNTPVTSGSFAIKVAKVSGIDKTTTFTAQPYITYEKDGSAEDAVYADKFTQEVTPD